MKYLFTIFFLTVSLNAFSKQCDLNGLGYFSYSASLDKNLTYQYSTTGDLTSSNIMIDKCESAVLEHKSLMVALAPVEYGFNTDQQFASYNPEIIKSNCRIDNAPSSFTQSFEDRVENNRRNINFIKKCVEANIQLSSSANLSYKEDQTTCTITRLTPNSAKFSGTSCVFNIPNKDSLYQIKFNLKKECADVSYLAENNLGPMELIAKSIFYTVSNPFGENPEYEYIGNRVQRFNIEPSSKIGKLNDQFDDSLFPQYFINYQLPDINLSEITLREGKVPELFLPLAVKNICPKKCALGICTSACDYSLPLVAEYELSEVHPSGKLEQIRTWSDGGAIPPNFQGIFVQKDTRIKELITGFDLKKKYNLHISFTDPYFDYLTFKKKFKSLIPPLPGFPAGNFYNLIDTGIEETNPLTGLTNIGEIKEINRFTGGLNSIGSIGGVLPITSHEPWPVQFEKICDPTGLNCKAPGNRPFLEFQVNFTVKKNEENQLVVDQLEITRKSTILSNYKIVNPKLPKEVCE